MKKIIFLLILGIFLDLNTLAFAQIKLDKYRERLDIHPGEIIKGSIVVQNTSKEEVAVRGYLVDFKYLPPFDGRKEFLELGSTPYSFGKWVTISPEVFKLLPSEKQKVTYTIKVPSDAKGGYCGVIFFERVTGGTEAGIGVILRMGCTLLLEAEDKIKKAEIVNVSVAQNNIEAGLLNSGNVILISQGSFNIIDKKGMIFDRGNIKKFYLPEQEQAKFTVNITDKIPAGISTLVINFDLEGGKPIVKEVDFSKDKAGNLKILKITD